MVWDTITVSTYRIWGINALQNREHILQPWQRLALALGQSSLARAKVAQSGRRTVARTHFLVTVGVNGHHESMDDFFSILDQVRGASPGGSERRFATRCLLRLGAVPGQMSKAAAIEAGTLVEVKHRL